MRRPSAAMVVAITALVSSLTGGAIAATVITSSSIKDGTIQLRDISPAARAALKGQRGPQGIDGLQGTPGAIGSAGASGVAGANGGFDPAKVTYVTSGQLSLASGNLGTATATCPAGTKVIGGGHLSSIANAGISEPLFDGTAWLVAVDNESGVTVLNSAFAVCAAP
jgi:hypothetical protein